MAVPWWPAKRLDRGNHWRRIKRCIGFQHGPTNTRHSPTSTSAATEVCQLLVKAAADATLITVVHNPSLLPLLANRVIGLKQRRIAFDLPVAAVDDEMLVNLYRPDAGKNSQHWQLPLGKSIVSG